MLHRLLNQSEEITYARLSAVCERDGAHVYPKVRLADIFPIAHSGVSDEDYRFSLQAHFDFTVTNKDYDPLFAVEFDSPFHRAPEQRARDERKDALCERFQLPILRINSNYLDKRYRGLDLLSYLVEVWFSAQAFDDAQEQGFVPMDEPFDPAWILSSPGHSNDFPFWLSLDIQVAIQRLYDEGRVFHPGPSHIVALDSNDIYRAIAYFYVTRQHVLVTETAMRGQRFPLVASDFLPDVAIRELYDDLLAYLKGEARAIGTRRFESRLRPYTEDYKLCSSSSWGMPEVNET